MKVSIITVTFNSAATLADTLRSVAGQTWQDTEHIIVDGASTDDTMSIVRRHSDKVAKVVSEPDRGVYDAMNKGLALSTGDIVGFLNADDMYASENALDQVVKAFSNPDVDACYADLVYVDRKDTSKVRRAWKSQVFTPWLFSNGWMPPHPTFFARRKVFKEYGYFDLSYRFAADFELMMRFLEVARIRTLYIPQVMVKMRAGGLTNSSVRNVIRGNIESYLACKKNGIQVTPFFPFRKVLSRIPQYFKRFSKVG